MLDINNCEVRNTKKYGEIFFVLGLSICLAGAALMFGGAVLGETTNVATLLGITGMVLIATQRRAMNNGGE